MRANPLSACAQNMTVFINGVAISNQLSDWSQLFSLGLYSEEYARQMSGSFSYGDQTQQYIGDSGQNAIGSNVSPFNTAEDACGGLAIYRGDNDYIILTNPVGDGVNPRTATMRIVSFEPLFSAPFMLQPRSDLKAIGGINLLQINYTLAQFNLQKALSLSPFCPNFSSINVALERGDLLMTIITPSPILGPLPNRLVYDCQQWNNFKFNLSSQTPSGAEETVTVPNVQLPCVPAKLLVWVSKSDANFTAFDSTSNATKLRSISCATDCLAYIKKVDLQFNNITGIWSAADTNGYQLWQAAYRNGLQMSWPQWQKHKGSICVFDFAKDIPSNALDAVQVSGQYNCSFRIIFKNPNDNVLPGGNIPVPDFYYTVNYCFIYDAVLEITPSFSRLSNGFDRSVVLRDINEGNVDVNVDFGYEPTMLGGAWYNNLADFKSSIIKGLTTVNKYLPIVKQSYESYLKPIMPKSADRIVEGALQIASVLVPKLLGNGVSPKKIKEMFHGQIGEHELEEMIAQHMNKHGSGLRGGKKIKHSRLA